MNLSKFALIATIVAPLTAVAVPITVSTTDNGNQGTDNVLFNNPALPDSGLLVQGDFNGSGSGYIVNFTSAGGNLGVGGGQAVLLGGSGNNPFTDVTVFLSDNATFTKAILNIDISRNNTPNLTVDFTVNYLDATGSPFVSTQSVDENGQNYFHIFAGDGARITSININANGNATFSDINQWRLGGFAPETNVPDGGSTVALMGVALAGLAMIRRKK